MLRFSLLLPRDRHRQDSIHLIGLDARGAIVLRQKLSRGQVEARQDGNHPTAPTVVNAASPSG